MLRILSDLHYLDADSRVRTLSQLDPLLEGVDHLVFNGDTCDTSHAVGPDELAGIVAHFTARVPRVTFLTGNHDPGISDTHELSLAGGAVWVTHGDVLFPGATPWSTLRAELQRRIDAALAEDAGTGIPAADPIARRLRAHRRACHGLPREFNHVARDPWSRLNRLRITLFPPRKLLAMLAAWRDTPRLAADLAAQHRPSAQVIITGHIHFPGVWRRPGGRTVINTGAFGPPRGALLVDLESTGLTVRHVRERGGSFRPGETVAAIPLAGPASAALP